MLGLVLAASAKPLEDKLMEMGLITLATGKQTLRFLPPLTVKLGEVDEALDMIADACAEMFGTPAAEEGKPE